jgi:hypothetical protein
MKVIGKMILDMVRDLNAIQTETLITVTLRWERLMGKVFILGAMVKYTMVNGIKDSSMVMESGEGCTMIHILENGDSLRQRVMVYIPGKTVIDMKANGNIASSMDKEQIFLLMVISTLENIKMESQRVKDNIPGRMAHSILVNSRTDSSMVRADGRVVKVLNAINMKETMFQIRKLAMEFLHGRVEIFIKENIRKMKEMAMEK